MAMPIPEGTYLRFPPNITDGPLFPVPVTQMVVPLMLIVLSQASIKVI